MQINDNVSVKNIDLAKTGSDKSTLSWEKEYWDKQVMQAVEGEEFKKSNSKELLNDVQKGEAVIEPKTSYKEAKSHNLDLEPSKTSSLHSRKLEKSESAYKLNAQVHSLTSPMVMESSNTKISDNGIKVYQGLSTTANQTSNLKKHLILEKDSKARVFTSQGEQTQSYRQKLAEAMSFFGLKLQTLIVRGREL